MAKAMKVCSTRRCPELVPRDVSRCDECVAKAEAIRGSAADRGYGSRHRRSFRRGVLLRHPLCTCECQGHTNHGTQCLRPSTVADHHPRSRRELVALSLDADDPQYGRGLCRSCHDQHTAVAQPGGWNAR